eukprot:Sdes_comp18703_c0_seq1m9007
MFGTDSTSLKESGFVSTLSSVHNIQTPLWTCDAFHVATDASFHSVSLYEKSALLLSNNNTIASFMMPAGEKAIRMVRARAYLHHYEKFGFGVEQLSSSVVDYHQIIQDYLHLGDT